MGAIILFAIVFAYLIITAVLKLRKEDSELIFPAIIGSFIASVCFVALIFCIMCQASAKIFDHYTYEHIATLSTHGNIAGSFVLGSGSIKSKTYYYFYKKEREGFKLDKIETEHVVIIENDSIHPALRKTTFRYTSKFTIFMLGNTHTTNVNAIIIPKGSIITSYNPNY